MSNPNKLSMSEEKLYKFRRQRFAENRDNFPNHDPEREKIYNRVASKEITPEQGAEELMSLIKDGD